MLPITSPFAHVSTFTTAPSAATPSMQYVSPARLQGAVATMQNVCAARPFNPARCAQVAQSVGMLRSQNACALKQAYAAGGAGSATGIPSTSLASLASTATPPAAGTVAAALAALGGDTSTSLARLC